MTETPVSLLARLKTAPPDSPDWMRWNELYQPVIRSWLARICSHGDELDDLAQEVLLILVRELPAYESRGKGSFRAWLRQITINQTRAYFKKRRKRPVVGLADDQEHLLTQLEDPGSQLSRQWDHEHDRHVWQKLQQLVKKDFEPTTWEAFCRFTLQEKPAARVAAELGISENAVLLAKYRVLKRLRQEAGEFLS